MPKTEEFKRFKKISKENREIRDLKQKRLNAKRLNSFFADNKTQICYWCGCLVHRGLVKNAKVKIATIDHIYDKRDLRRYLVTEEENTVISCYNCNQKRNDSELAKRKYNFDRDDLIDIIELCKNLNNNKLTRS